MKLFLTLINFPCSNTNWLDTCSHQNQNWICYRQNSTVGLWLITAAFFVGFFSFCSFSKIAIANIIVIIDGITSVTNPIKNWIFNVCPKIHIASLCGRNEAKVAIPYIQITSLPCVSHDMLTYTQKKNERNEEKIPTLPSNSYFNRMTRRSELYSCQRKKNPHKIFIIENHNDCLTYFYLLNDCHFDYVCEKRIVFVRMEKYRKFRVKRVEGTKLFLDIFEWLKFLFIEWRNFQCNSSLLYMFLSQGQTLLVFFFAL